MVELICDGYHIHPAVIRATFRMFGPERVILISDSMRATGMKNGTYELGGQEVTVKDRKAEHPYKFNDKFYAKVDGKFYEITREVAKAMLSAYRNEVYRSKKWQPEDPETMTRKTKWTELLDCVFSENTDGIGVQDLPDECQRSVEDLVILQAESAELHQNIAKLSEHEQFIIKSIYFDGMKQVELAKKLEISKVRMSQKVSAILKKMRKMYEIG